jgi:hypothetical protein
LRALARRASAAGGRIAVSLVPAAARVDLTAAATGDAGNDQPVPRIGGAVYPEGSEARFDATVTVRQPGRHLVFVGGAFRRQLDLLVDGRKVSSRRHRLNHEGQYEPLGQIDLSRGSHRIGLRYRPADLAPGSGGPAFPLGPLYVVRESNPRIKVVSPARARALCGRRLDWMESVSR